jgi:hypothetical protein
MKPGIDLIYKLNGQIDEGINVFELSPILLSVGTLINEAHKTLYPEDREIAVNIKPFQKGSFEINILLCAADILQQFLDFVKSDTGQNVSLVLAYLGYTSQFSGINLIQLIYLMKGKKIKSIEPLESGEVRYHSDDNTSVTIVKQVDTLYQNCNIQQNIYGGLGRPLELPAIESIESFIKHNEDSTKVIHKKDIAPSIKEYSTAELCVTGEPETTENVRTIWVRPITANLEGGPKSWSFRSGEDEKITANISDEEFLEIIKSGAKLSSMDKLLVIMKDKQIVRGPNISTSHEIIEVKKYLKGPEQEYLFKK